MNDFGTPRKWARGLDVRRFFKPPSFLNRPIPVVYKVLGLVVSVGIIALLLYLMLNKSDSTAQQRQRTANRARKSRGALRTLESNPPDDMPADVVARLQRDLYKTVKVGESDVLCAEQGTEPKKALRMVKCYDISRWPHTKTTDDTPCIGLPEPPREKVVPRPTNSEGQIQNCPIRYIWKASEWVDKLPTLGLDSISYNNCNDKGVCTIEMTQGKVPNLGSLPTAENPNQAPSTDDGSAYDVVFP
jgi:hypothetical protein